MFELWIQYSIKKDPGHEAFKKTKNKNKIKNIYTYIFMNVWDYMASGIVAKHLERILTCIARFL